MRKKKKNSCKAQKPSTENIEDLNSRPSSEEKTELIEQTELSTHGIDAVCQVVLDNFDYVQKKVKLYNANKSVDNNNGKIKKDTEKSCVSSGESVDIYEKKTTEEKSDPEEIDKLGDSKTSKRSYTSRNRTQKQCDQEDIKAERNSCKKEDKESLKKIQAQVYQQRLNNKLRKAAGIREIVFCSRKFETEIKLSASVNGMNQQNDPSSSITGTTNTLKEPDLAACPVTPITSDNKLIRDSVFNSKDKKNCSNENGNLDWRDRLLFLEMSHDKFDEDYDINVAENELNDDSKRKTRSAGPNDLKVDKNNREPKTKRMRNMSKNFKETEVIPFSFSTPLDNSIIRRRYLKKESCKRTIRLSSGRNNDTESSNVRIEDNKDGFSETSSLDLSLPTPRPPRDDTNPFSLSMSEEKMDDDGSSDEDLPVGLTPLKIEKTPSENDIVWVKWKTWPHLPALVRKVYKKRKRLTCAVFHPNGFEKDFTLSYSNPESVIPYCDPKKDEILESAKNLPDEDQVFFRTSCAEAQNYMTKKALKSLKSQEVCKENLVQDEPAVINDIQEVECNEDKGEATPCKKKPRLSDCVVTKIEQRFGLSKEGQKRAEKRKLKTRPLLDFLISDKTKEYLENIYNGRIKSELHDKFFTGTIREKAKMKHRGFGPIDDDEQIEVLLNTYMTWIEQINKNIHLNDVNYVFDVWVPEAVVFAFKKMNRYSCKRAWDRFNAGVRRTKEELQIMHNDMVS